MANLRTKSIEKLERKAQIRKEVAESNQDQLTSECEWHSDNCLYCKSKNGDWVLIRCLDS
jgi:hypothetical protein